MSGMPVMIKLVVESDEKRSHDKFAEPNKFVSDKDWTANENSTDIDLDMKAKITKLNNKLEKRLQETFDKIKAETVLTYTPLNRGQTNKYFLYFMIVRAAQGYDTKTQCFQ